MRKFEWSLTAEWPRTPYTPDGLLLIIPKILCHVPMDIAKMAAPTPLNIAYPWIRSPFIASAPMRLIALAPLAFAVSKAGGLGFLAAGTDVTDLKRELQAIADLVTQSSFPGSSSHPLPIGVWAS